MKIKLLWAETFWFIVLENVDLAMQNGIAQPIEWYNFSAGGFLKSADQCTHFKSKRLAQSIHARLLADQQKGESL